MSVALHPQQSRSGQQQHESAQVVDSFASPFFPKLESLLPSPPPRRPSLTPTQSNYSSYPAAHGLSHLNPDNFPRFSTHGDLRVISAEQYAQLQHEYSLHKLPEEVLFPWLHGGADVPFSPAAAYFGFTRGTATAPPRCVLYPSLLVLDGAGRQRAGGRDAKRVGPSHELCLPLAPVALLL